MFALWLATALATPGTVSEITCEAPWRCGYTLYLPTGWSEAGRWPLVLVLDPVEPDTGSIADWIAGAEALGFVVARIEDPLRGRRASKIAREVLVDVGRRASVDPERIVLAGTGSLARIAWVMATDRPRDVIGVIGMDGATPGEVPPDVAPSFGWIGLSEVTGVGYQEVRQVDEAIQRLGGASTFEPLGADTPPEDALARALARIVLYSQQVARWPLDGALTVSVVAGERERIEAMGATWEAWLAARGLPQLGPVAEALAAAPTVRRRVALERRLAGQEQIAAPRIRALVAWLLDPEREPPSVDRGLAELRAAALQRAVRRWAGDPRGDSAARILNTAHHLLVTVTAEELAERGDGLRRGVALELATRLRPDDARSWWLLGCALAEAGGAGADDALQQASALGGASACDPAP